jgi:hypothetical protein
LSKQAAMRLLAVFHQGARSIDAVLHPSQSNWTELRRYYSADRREMITLALGDLGFESAAPAAANSHSPQYSPEPWSPLSVLMNFIANRWRKRWFVSESERVFFGTTLGRLWNLLACDQQPPQEALVQLRLDLTTAAGCVHRHLVGTPELGSIRRVEYYAPPTSKQLYSISEVLRHAE